MNQYHEIPETDYQNNIVNTSVIIEPPPIPLANFVSLTAAKQYDHNDQELTFNLGLYNAGSVQYFLENYQLTIYNEALVPVHASEFYTEIGYSGESAIEAVTVTLQNPLAPGNYTVEVKCPSSCYTTPTSISTTLEIKPSQYTLTGTLQGEDGLPLTSGKLFLYQKSNDGTIKFVQKITPVTQSDFTFGLDNHEHTLYFIPDRSTSPEYVPTVYGKTVMLAPGSFFQATGDMDVVFEILKVQPLASGTGVINGTVTSSVTDGANAADQRSSGENSRSAMGGVAVVLLSSTGAVVGITYTDASGFYEFTNLPRDEYQVLVSLELDQPGMTSPHEVDINAKNATVDFQLSPTGIVPEESILMLEQVITFEELPAATYGNSPISLSATTSSSLPLTFTSSDVSIASVEGTSIVILGAGEVIITANQNGNQFYNPAAAVPQTLIIAKATQTISFEAIGEKQLTDEPFEVQASATSSLPLTFTSDNENVAKIDGSRVKILNAGSANITVSQPGNVNYLAAAPVSRMLIVQQIVGVETQAGALRIYPNPARNVVSVEGVAIDRIEIINILGQRETLFTLDNGQLDISHLKAGSYMLRFTTGAVIQTRRMVKH